MKISYNWLKTLINIDLTPQQIDEYLTSSGLEVEGIEAFETIKGGLKGIVIGEVVEKEKHPDADKLSITKVDVGGPELIKYCVWCAKCGGRTKSISSNHWCKIISYNRRTI